MSQPLIPGLTASGELLPSGPDQPPGEPGIEVIYYTDPLCPWSWALEPQWRRLRYEIGDRLTWRYVMGGMIVNWESYHDQLNSVHNPSQMALQWYQVRQLTGMPVDERIWYDDPPSSSYPACLAVKSAERQGAAMGEAYLRQVREAVMLGRRNVARGEVLIELAEELAGDPPPGGTLDLEQFRDDLLGAAVRDAFHEDLREVRFRAISRFPTLDLKVGDRPRIALTGYRPYEAIREAIARLVPDLGPLRTPPGLVDLITCWRRVVDREVAEALRIEVPATRQLLESAAAAGLLQRDDLVPGGYRAPPPSGCDPG